MFSISIFDNLVVIPLIRLDISSILSLNSSCFEEESIFSSLTFFLSLPPHCSTLSLLEARRFDSTSMVASCMSNRVVSLAALIHNANFASNALAYVIMVVVLGGLTSTCIF